MCLRAGDGSSLTPGSRLGVIVLLLALSGLGLSAAPGAAACSGFPPAATSMAMVPPRSMAPPTADVELCVEARQDQRIVTYTIHFHNVGGTFVTVDLRDRLPAGTEFLGDPMSVVDGVWNDTFEDLAPGPHSIDLAVGLNGSVADGDRIVNLVIMDYRSTGQRVKKTYEHELVVVFSGDVTAPTTPMWVLAAPLAAGAGGAAGVVAYVRMRRPRIEQVFLMHNSGTLIRHWAVNASPGRDIDILTAMFVVLKEFVRDSFREKQGGLSQVQFGDSHLLLAEGRHSVLATVVSGGRLNGLASHIDAAVKDFEGRNALTLPDWNGQVETLDGAGAVIDNLVLGRYRHLRRAT